MSIIGAGKPLTRQQEQNSWPYKAVLATRGNQTLMGCVVLAVIGRQPKHPPYIASAATVDQDGLVWVQMARIKDGGQISLACIGNIIDVRDDFRRLADHLKLDDGERIDMFEELRKWVAIDMRADHNEMKNKTTH